MQVRAGNPVRPMLAQRMSEPAEILAKLGGACAAEYKYDGIRVQAHRTADGQLELFTRRLERVSGQFPDVVELLQTGLGPREVILEGEVVAFDPASGELRPFQDVMFRRRKYGITEAVSDVPVSLFCFELLYADGEDLTRLPYLERRARLAEAITPSPRLRLATAEQVDDEAALEAVFEQAVADGCEGLICKSLAPTAGYQAGARGWPWIKLKRDYRSELTDTLDLVVVGGAVRAGPARRHVRGAAAGRLRPGRGQVPDDLQVRHRVQRRRAGRRCRLGWPRWSATSAPARVDARRARRRVVRARPGGGGAGRRADPVADPHRRLGSAQGGLRAGVAVPALHRPLARRQGRRGRHHRRGGRGHVPGGPADPRRRLTQAAAG